MTVKLSVSLPDDVAAWLARQRNTSAAVAEAVRAQMDSAEARSQRRRDSANVYGDWLRARAHDNPEEHAADLALVEYSNEMSLRGNEW